MSKSLHHLIGLDAPSAVEALLSNLEEIREIRLAECQPLPLLQHRFELTSAERVAIDKALALRGRTGISFWDAILLELPNEMEAIRLLDAAMMHNSFVGDEHSISREVAARGGIRRLCDDFKPTDSSSLTFLSEVICHDGTLRHIPMVDFQRI